MPILILGGIYSGIFTATEASVVAVVYGLIIGTFVYKKIKLQTLKQIFSESVLVIATLSFIISTASFFGVWLTLERIPHSIATFISDLNLSAVIVMILIVILLLIVGMFMDEISAIIILTPILLPIATSVGIDPVHFGVIMVINLAIGLLTPPVGLSLFMAAKIGNIIPEKLIKPMMPFVIIMTIDVFLLLLLPQLSIGVVSLISNK